MITDFVQQLLGCAWGRTVWDPSDSERCPQQAVQIVVLHDGLGEVEVRLCAHHRAIIFDATDPHEAT